VSHELLTVMGSCRVRETARARTIPQLRQAGLDPIVFLSPCTPAGPEQNRAIAYEAITHAIGKNLPTLYVEDDIDIDQQLFQWALDLAVRLDAVTYLYLNDTPARMREHFGREIERSITNEEGIIRGAYAVRERAALFGTQCVLIPARLLGAMQRILEFDSGLRRRMPWDGRLHTWLREHRDERVFSILPHPIQHRQDRTGRTEATKVMRSMSYGMRWTDPHDAIEFVDDWAEGPKYRPVLRTRASIAEAFVMRRQRQRDEQRENQ
jgi:hypothetical protein